MLGQTSGGRREGWIWLAGRAAVCTQVLREPSRAKAEQGREGRPAPQSSLLLLLVEGWPLHRQVVVPLLGRSTMKHPV